MSPELTRPARDTKNRIVRVDRATLNFSLPGLRGCAAPFVAVMAIGFVLVGTGQLDLMPTDARVGLAAGEAFGPLGQVYGNWAPDLWPGPVGLSKAASLLAEGGRVTPGSVSWPAALAAVAIGWRLARRMMRTAGLRAGLWFALCWFGSLGVIDHSGGTGFDFLSGLAIVAAIDRLLAYGSDFVAGLWAALAFLMGGWPPVIVIFLTVIVIGRREARFSPRLLIPPAVTAIGWSIWALASTSTEAWAAALAFPFSQHPAWGLLLEVIGLGLPFSPLALLALYPPLRQLWSGPCRQLVAGWSQATIACAIAGTIVPGLSQSARVPVLAGILMAAAAGIDVAWTCSLRPAVRRVFLAFAFGLVVLWLMILVYGGYLWLMVFPYYRPVGISALLLGVPVLVLGWRSISTSSCRRAVLSMVFLTVSLKLVHWGYYVPEWNYRHGQGPWGRAIGQWLLPNWAVYTFHDWPPDLAVAIGRPVRQLRTPQHLAFEGSGQSRHVLLLESEFEHWPQSAPHLLKVATFHDQEGGRRVLARTPGVLVTPSGAFYSNEEP
jgi:hypothetical protein